MFFTVVHSICCGRKSVLYNLFRENARRSHLSTSKLIFYSISVTELRCVSATIMCLLAALSLFRHPNGKGECSDFNSQEMPSDENTLHSDEKERLASLNCRAFLN